MPSNNPITQFLAATIQQEQQHNERVWRHLTIVRSILSVRFCDAWCHNERGEDMGTWGDNSGVYRPVGMHCVLKLPTDKLSVNSEKYEVVVETYMRNAMKRRERFLADIAQDKEILTTEN